MNQNDLIFAKKDGNYLFCRYLEKLENDMVKTNIGVFHDYDIYEVDREECLRNMTNYQDRIKLLIMRCDDLVTMDELAKTAKRRAKSLSQDMFGQNLRSDTRVGWMKLSPHASLEKILLDAINSKYNKDIVKSILMDLYDEYDRFLYEKDKKCLC